MWNDLTMKERADLIKQGVALGYKDIDAIRNNYHTFSKGSTVYTDSNPYYNRLPDSKKKEWRSLSARRQQFLKLMQQYAPQLYNDSQLRNVMEYIAFNEGRWGNTGVSKQGARGYFQLMPDTISTARRSAGKNYNVNNPADDFAMTQITAQNSMKYIQKLWQNPEFRRKAEEKGYTPYDLLMSSWLAGPTGMKNNILKGTNPKDAYGTSISNYVGNTDSQPGAKTMVINTGIEGKPVIITSTPEVEEAVRQNNMPNDVTVSNVPVQQDQDVSNTYLLDQYNRILGDNEALRGQYEELSEQERQLKERYEEVLQEQEQEDQAKYLRSLLNIGRTTPIMQVPALGTISTQSTGSINDPYSNNNILAQQMYGTKMGNMRNGSFGKYFFNNPEERTPVVVNYNPYSPIQGGFAYGGSIHRFGEGDTVVTRPPLQAAQNQFAVPEYHYYDDWDPEQFYPTTKIGDAIYDNFDANAPAEPIQSYPNVGEVNPKYYNPTVKGEPVKILHRVQDNDQQAVAQYQDGELGIVNLPDNYWQRYLPEVVVPGRMQQLQGVIDQANEGKTIFEQQQDMEDAFRYQDEARRAQQNSFYNPRAILDNTSRIPIIGALPAMSEYAYGMLKGGPEGQYWKDRASGAAEEQLIPIGLAVANSNPVTAAIADSALLGSSLYDINRNGINGENTVGLALGMLGPTVRGTQLVRNNTLPYNLGDVDVAGSLSNTEIPLEEGAPAGYQLKSLFKGNPLEKQLSKNGTISINSIKNYISKASNIEKLIVNEVLNSNEFNNQNTINYIDFKRAVQTKLIQYNRVPATKWQDFGTGRLGLNNDRQVDLIKKLVQGNPDKYVIDQQGHLIERKTGREILNTEQDKLIEPFKNQYNTYTFESPRIPIGNAKHYNRGTLGHSRTYITPEEPQVLHVMESQSDWAQNKPTELLKTHDIKNLQDWEDEMAFQKENQGEGYKGVSWEKEMEGLEAAKAYVDPETSYLIDNYERRQLQENLKYAAEHGLTKMRYPTRETAAKIEGYQPVQNDPAIGDTPYFKYIDDLKYKLETDKNLSENERAKINSEIKRIEKIEARWKAGGATYEPKLETILDKYSNYPKLFNKLYKKADVRVVEDSRGNTWYEVDVPENYLEQEWPYKYGGTLKY